MRHSESGANSSLQSRLLTLELRFMNSGPKQHDVFISHASEDKEAFVRPLAVALRNLGASVWFDEFTLRVGDSLSRSIDHGLVSSTFGLVVVSRAFMEKPWPEYELRGLVTREIEDGRVILPVWLSVTRKEVANFSPTLADKVALIAEAAAVDDLAIRILREIRPDLYERHPRGELMRLANGADVPGLTERLSDARVQLSEFECPHCCALLVEQIHAPADASEQAWDLRRIFACGYQEFGGQLERPCPSDPCFPAFEDYEISFEAMSQDEPYWLCYARGKTPIARLVSLSPQGGKTKDEARKAVHENYQRIRRPR